MDGRSLGPMVMSLEKESWPLATPFRISQRIFEVIDVIRLGLRAEGRFGQAEAAGVYFRNDDVLAMTQQLEQLRATIEAGITRERLQQILPPGGARNALDCALWDLEAKCRGMPVWQLAGLTAPRPLLTTFGCGADAPESMAAAARAYTDAKAIKLKLTGESIDADRVRCVREARPDVWLGVDANQGFTRAFLEKIMPVFEAARVLLIEQPFPVGQEHLLDDFNSPIPIAADESLRGLADIARLANQFDVVNIKLDKCGGLTEALKIANAARQSGLDTMVGNMFGTSLAMAPAFLLGQLCDVVDLDGPIFLRSDRVPCAQYANGYLVCTEDLWGGTSDNA